MRQAILIVMVESVQEPVYIPCNPQNQTVLHARIQNIFCSSGVRAEAVL
jgi:hypothetical protein